MATTAKTQTLSPAARTALTNAGTSRLGAPVPTGDVYCELYDLGLIGPGGGLTMAGGIMRDRIQTEDLDRLF